MRDDRLDERIREAARAYNAPPETPREQMWSRIAATRTGDAPRAAAVREPRVLPLRPRRWLALAAAAAAMLAVGVSIGRVSVAPEGTSWRGPTANATAYGMAARASHLGVHVLGDEDRALAELFGSTTGDEIDKFERCRWTPGAFGVPLLDDCRRRGIFEVTARHDVGGDHDLFVLTPIDITVDITAGGADDTALRVGALDIEPGHPVPPE